MSRFELFVKILPKEPPQRQNPSFLPAQIAHLIVAKQDAAYLKHVTDLQGVCLARQGLHEYSKPFIKIRSLFDADRASPLQQASARFTFLAKKTSEAGKHAKFTPERMGAMGRHENLEISWIITPWMSRTLFLCTLTDACDEVPSKGPWLWRATWSVLSLPRSCWRNAWDP